MPASRQADGTLRREATAVTSAATVEEQVAVQGTSEDGVLTVTIRGDLDVATAPVLCGYLAQALPERPRLIVFDLAGVGFMDCAAAAAIKTCHAMPGGPRLVLCHPRPVVRRLLSLTGLDAQCAVRP
jgi:anti-anti-sigma factor